MVRVSFLGCFLVFVWSCLKTAPPIPNIVFPNTELQEIIVYGSYRPKRPEKIKASIEEYRRRGQLKEGESFREKYPRMLISGDERFNLSTREYCYKKTKEEDKAPLFNKKFKALLYNKEGEVLEENYLRLRNFSETHKVSSVVIYLPYHEEASYIRVVRLEKGKKITIPFSAVKVYSKSYLEERSVPDMPRYRNSEFPYRYSERSYCHILVNYVM
ncbi:MAG: hypothetical protein OXJ52_07745 [Oligoflexia bacterium]|nr:hypothetical protein [Oligoflexia bacterium]